MFNTNKNHSIINSAILFLQIATIIGFLYLWLLQKDSSIKNFLQNSKTYSSVLTLITVLIVITNLLKGFKYYHQNNKWSIFYFFISIPLIIILLLFV